MVEAKLDRGTGWSSDGRTSASASSSRLGSSRKPAAFQIELRSSSDSNRIVSHSSNGSSVSDNSGCNTSGRGDGGISMPGDWQDPPLGPPLSCSAWASASVFRLGLRFRVPLGPPLPCSAWASRSAWASASVVHFLRLDLRFRVPLGLPHPCSACAFAFAWGSVFRFLRLGIRFRLDSTCS